MLTFGQCLTKILHPQHPAKSSLRTDWTYQSSALSAWNIPLWSESRVYVPGSFSKASLGVLSSCGVWRRYLFHYCSYFSHCEVCHADKVRVQVLAVKTGSPSAACLSLRGSLCTATTESSISAFTTVPLHHFLVWQCVSWNWNGYQKSLPFHCASPSASLVLTQLCRGGLGSSSPLPFLSFKAVPSVFFSFFFSSPCSSFIWRSLLLGSACGLEGLAFMMPKGVVACLIQN